jgi:GDPmannose 4,6-dehydratase
MSKKVIVSGATGQDGSYMIEYLLENTNNTVIAGIRRTSQAILSNLKNVIDNPRLKLVTVDLCDVYSINKLIEDEKPDYFINLGAYSYVADSWVHPSLHMQTNAISLIHILEAVRKYVPNCRVYSAGSSEQWGDVKYSPQDEKHPMSPRSVYGISKCAASHICKVYRESYNLYVVHGILTNHESPRRQDYFVTRKITKGVARIKYCIDNNLPFEPIELGNLEAKRDWSHAKDFVDGMWRMLNQEDYRKDIDSYFSAAKTLEISGDTEQKFLVPQLKEYVLSSDETHSIKEFVELAFKEAGIYGAWIGSGQNETFIITADKLGEHSCPKDMTLVKINPKFYRLADVELLQGDSTLARKELRWSPKYSFNELVEEMVWFDIKDSKNNNSQ